MVKAINLEHGRAIVAVMLDSDHRLDKVTIESIEGSEVCVTTYDKLPKGAEFTRAPLSEKGVLYTRVENSYPENIKVLGNDFNVINYNIWWERQYDVTPDDIDQEDYYNMVLTDQGEWCFAPLFAEAANKEYLKYTTPYYEEIETRLLSA